METKTTVISKQPTSSGGVIKKITTTREYVYDPNSPIVTQQITTFTKENIPSIPSCPPELEFLLNLDSVFIDQDQKYFQDIPEYKNKFVILDQYYNPLFRIVENGNFVTTFLLGRMRGFSMNAIDMKQKNVMEFISEDVPYCCGIACYSCFGFRKYVKIEVPSGNVIGMVRLTGYYIRPVIKVENEIEEMILKIKGPFLTGKCWTDNVYKIYDTNGTEVGQIIGKWSGCKRECLTDSDRFQIIFPPNSNPKTKALLIGACILIDYMFYHWDSLRLSCKEFLNEPEINNPSE